jgi:NAD(P)-dependent dehydrogenase (short-subunit alcohol dehydrogenase family)
MSGIERRLEGKIAVVTGGGGARRPGVGIGQAISLTLARAGTSVVLVDMIAEHAETTRLAIEQEGGTASVFVGDVSREADCEGMVDAATERFGGMDILVNNAAITRHVPIVETTMDLYQSVLGVNLTGAFMACKYAVPALVERGGGSIVNIGSVAGVRDSGSTHPAYSASKAALVGLTVDLAGACGQDNIRVNTVLPGMIASPMQESVGRVDEDTRRRLNLLGRMGSVWDIASAVSFLCSDEAAYITGITLPVDGGATASMPGSALRAGAPGHGG